MADYRSYGSINFWTRSSDLRNLGQCPMSWLLGRLYKPTVDKGYFFFGTGLHLGVQRALEGDTLERATEIAVQEVIDLVNESLDAGREVEWTKKRPVHQWVGLATEMMSQWWTDVMPPEGEPIKGMPTQMPFYRDREPIALEFTTNTAEINGVTTEIDSIWKRTAGVPGYDIVDWKTGSTQKSDSLQLWLYNYATRHTPGSPLEGVEAEDVGMWFHHLAFSKLQQADPYPGDDYMLRVLEYSQRQRALIAEDGFAPCKPDWYCNYCQSKSICPVVGTGDLTKIIADAKMAPAELVRPE